MKPRFPLIASLFIFVGCALPLAGQSLSMSTIQDAMQAIHPQTVWPVANSTPDDIESTFGPRWQTSTQRYDFHRGLDFDGVEGDNILAAAPGRFYEYRYFSAGGWTIILEHDLVQSVSHNGRTYDHYYTYYMHLFDDGDEGVLGTDDMVAGWNQGDAIAAGQHIGEMGATGSSGGAAYADHLHFEVRLFARTSLAYQLDPDNTTTQHGFDPHIHPMLMWSDDASDFFWPNNYDQAVEQVGTTEANTDLTVVYTTDDETAALNEATVTLRDESDNTVIKTHTINFSTREGIDATSTTAIDDPDENLPYFDPQPFGDTATEFDTQLIVPSVWLEAYGEGYSVDVEMANIWGQSTATTIALVPEPSFFAVGAGVGAIAWTWFRRRERGLSRDDA